MDDDPDSVDKLEILIDIKKEFQDLFIVELLQLNIVGAHFYLDKQENDECKLTIFLDKRISTEKHEKIKIKIEKILMEINNEKD